jgi:hypothetical protein
MGESSLYNICPSAKFDLALYEDGTGCRGVQDERGSVPATRASSCKTGAALCLPRVHPRTSRSRLCACRLHPPRASWSWPYACCVHPRRTIPRVRACVSVSSCIRCCIAWHTRVGTVPALLCDSVLCRPMRATADQRCRSARGGILLQGLPQLLIDK